MVRPHAAAPSLQEALAFLTTSPWFEEVPSAALEALSRQTKWRACQSGERVYRAREMPQGLFGLMEGSVKIGTGNADGQDAVTTVIAAGTWFGDVFYGGQCPYFMDCTALQPSRLLFIPHAALEMLGAEFPVLYRNLLAEVSKKALHSFWMAAQYKLSSPEMLVARRLEVALRTSPSTPHGEWVELHERLSHELIAQMLGLSRPRVSQAMKALADDGVLCAQRGRIRIHAQRLTAYCIQN